MRPSSETISQYSLRLADEIRSGFCNQVENVKVTFSDNRDDVYFLIDFKAVIPGARTWYLCKISICDLINAETSFKDKVNYMVLENCGVDID